MNADDVTLPDLSAQRVDEMENALFGAIASERAQQHAVQRRRRARRGRLWLTGAAAAVVIVAAAAIAPALTQPGVMGTSESAFDSGVPQVAPAAEPGVFTGTVTDGLGQPDGRGLDGGGVSQETTAAQRREIVATASASVRVDDVSTAADRIGDAARDAGGYVESMSVGQEGRILEMGALGVDGAVMPVGPSDAWVTVRVPADRLSDVMGGLAEVGDVLSSRIVREDVTSHAVDLRARVRALEASVERLTALMSDAESTADLLAAESALSQRQSELESYRSQLEGLDDRVAMSTLGVSLTATPPPVSADPAGFGDGLLAGWNGLVATVNGIVVGLGFLLPWIGVLAVAGALVWLIVRLARRARAAGVTRTDDAGPGAPGA